MKEWTTDGFLLIGQGPYFGQAAWFAVFHAEKVCNKLYTYLDPKLQTTNTII